MKATKTIKKLQLKKETINNLSKIEGKNVIGGRVSSAETSYPSHTSYQASC